MKNTILFSAKSTICTIATLLCIQIVMAQSVGIGTASPKPSARLEVNSTTQGILIPTLTSAQRNTISNPATGLLVFQSDGTPGFYYYTGTNWLSLANGHQPNTEGIAVSSGYGVTTTLAGTGTFGSTDGPAATATFDNPTGVAVDAFGNIYVADQSNQKIRKINPAGQVSTMAGSSTRGFADGFGSNALFDFPTGVAVDGNGYIYVSDQSNNRIRKINPINGFVSTLAGGPIAGFANGNGSDALFNFPAGLAVDAAGNIYVADRNNHMIRKISSLGVVSTLAGSLTAGDNDGTGSAASFRRPSGVAVDGAGNVYVADFGNHKIRKITPGGAVSTLAGGPTAGSNDGPADIATFESPAGVAVDAFSNVYVADMINHKIRKITPVGVVSTLAGIDLEGYVDGAGNVARFYRPFGLALDGSGNLYVADMFNSTIRKIIVQ
jgi:sugar lactone lactonase YvrE